MFQNALRELNSFLLAVGCMRNLEMWNDGYFFHLGCRVGTSTSKVDHIKKFYVVMSALWGVNSTEPSGIGRRSIRDSLFPPSLPPHHTSSQQA